MTPKNKNFNVDLLANLYGKEKYEEQKNAKGVSSSINQTDCLTDARYFILLDTVISSLNPVYILRLDFEAGYQGFVDIDVLLEDSRVFSYKYSYGSCSHCDTWEHEELTNKQIEARMLQEATVFPDYQSYLNWRATCQT